MFIHKTLNFQFPFLENIIISEMKHENKPSQNYAVVNCHHITNIFQNVILIIISDLL